MDHVVTTATDFTGWLPIRLFPQDGTLWVDWIYRGSHAFRDSFFRDDVQRLLRQPFNLAFRRYTPITAMVEWAATGHRNAPGARHVPLKALLAHTSRCGSTLVAQMLAQLPTHIVMSEPPMVDVVLRIRSTLPQVTREEQIIWLRALVFALGQAPGHEQHLVIKLDAWHVLEWSLLQDAFPQVPALFLYRDPVEIAASLFTQPSAYMVTGMITAYSRRGDGCAEAPFTTAGFIARDLGALFDAGVALCQSRALRPVHYPSLPAAVWTELASLLGLSGDAQQFATLQAASKQDAKMPSTTFEHDSQRKQLNASVELRAAISERCLASYNCLLAITAALN